MPSQTVHLPTELYRYVMDTHDDSISARIAELAEKGKRYENEVEE